MRYRGNTIIKETCTIINGILKERKAELQEKNREPVKQLTTPQEQSPESRTADSPSAARLVPETNVSLSRGVPSGVINGPS